MPAVDSSEVGKGNLCMSAAKVEGRIAAVGPHQRAGLGTAL